MSRKYLQKISEREVVALWQEQMRARRTIEDSEGENIEVIYPGRPNDCRGADFRDAVVASRNELKQGCIEVHTLASKWHSHGHDKDPVYNQVVLHVALKQARAGKTFLQNGQSVPTVILEKSLRRETRRVPPDSGLACAGVARRLDPDNLLNLLEKAGDFRFAEKAARYQSVRPLIEAGQNLYQSLLESLGYARNKLPFLELARQVPLRLAESLIRNENEEDGLYRLQAFLLGQAGFLPSQRSGSIHLPEDKYVEKLEKLWCSFSLSPAMDFHQWELYKVRPGNHPVRRLIALSQLLFRYRQPGLLPAFLGLIRDSPPEIRPASLEKALFTRVEGYWADHYDFGIPDPAAGPVVLGSQRAAEILINVLFPFVFSWSRLASETGLGYRVLDLYARYPRLETNSIERHMVRQLALNFRLLNSARRQQGLLHIYKTFCIQGKCGKCELA